MRKLMIIKPSMVNLVVKPVMVKLVIVKLVMENLVIGSSGRWLMIKLVMVILAS